MDILKAPHQASPTSDAAHAPSEDWGNPEAEARAILGKVEWLEDSDQDEEATRLWSTSFERFFEAANDSARRQDWMGAERLLSAAIVLAPEAGALFQFRAVARGNLGRTEEAELDVAEARRRGHRSS